MDRGAVEADRCQRLVENSAGRTDERSPASYRRATQTVFGEGRSERG